MDALHKLKKSGGLGRGKASVPLPPSLSSLCSPFVFFALTDFFSTFSPTVVLGPRLVPRHGLNLILFKSILIQTHTELNMIQKDIQNSL